ncbi:MAG: hypothetical protein R2715_08105 [Ilumatobacteraceae bacterium]
MRLFHTIRDYTADARWLATGHHAARAKGLYAQQIVARKNYDMGRTSSMARQAPGITESGEVLPPAE